MWFYFLENKQKFFNILGAFLTFVQTQFTCKIKIFHSDGGTQFLNKRVHTLLMEIRTRGNQDTSSLILPKRELAMLFNTCSLTSLWVDPIQHHHLCHQSSVLPTSRSQDTLRACTTKLYMLFFHGFVYRFFHYLHNQSAIKLSQHSLVFSNDTSPFMFKLQSQVLYLSVSINSIVLTENDSSYS